MKNSGILTLFLISGITVFLFPVSTALAQQGPVQVIAHTVQKVEFIDEIEALGTLRANESVDLTVNVTETIMAIHFEDGMRVDEGDILVEMTSKEENAQLSEALATYEEAKRQFERVKPLVERGNASESVLDERRREFQTAKARYEAIESRLQDRLVVAPFGGLVGLRNISKGALVRPGDIITTIVDDSVMKLDFRIPSIFLSSIHPNLKIEAETVVFRNRKFEGTISSIDSRIDPVTRSVAVRALIDNPDGLLRTGLLMTVELQKDPRQTLVIPEEAILSEGREKYVFMIDTKDDKNTALKREIEIGSRRPGEVEVLSGLSEGDDIITHGIIKVRPGSEVHVKAKNIDDEDIENVLKPDKPS